MANRRSKSWYISRLVRANGIVRDEVVNVEGGGGSSDSDVAAIAQLRREADSDSIRIQEIATELEGINELVDSDLKAIADLRNDVDSDSIKLQALEESVEAVEGIDSDFVFSAVKIKASKNYYIQSSQPTITDVGQYWYNTDSDILYKSESATTLTTTMPAVSLASGTPYNKQVDYPGLFPSSATRTNISGTDALGGTFTLGTTAEAWFYFYGGPYPGNPGYLNGGVYYTFDTAQDLRGIIIENSDPNAGRLERIDYEDGSYADNGFPGGGTVTYYNSDGTTMGKTASANTTGNTFVDISHPNGQLATRIGFSQIGDYPAGNDVFLFFAGGRVWSPVKKGFDSDQIVAIINENTSAGSIDSDVAAVAQLRRDADSDSIGIQALRTSMDSDYALFNAKFALLNGLTDSDLTTVANLRNDLDSESAVIRSLSANNSSSTNITQTVYTYTTTGAQTTFSGADDNSQTLSYSVGRIQVYLNGLLLSEGASADYTATDGTSVVLTEASDSEDVLTVVKYLGTQDDVITNKYIYKVAPAGNHIPFDSEFSGADENGSILSYTSGKIQVFLNGILLQDSDDYTATDGSSIYLLTAPDSEDVLVVYRYLGTQVAGFDSDQVVAIINENTSSAGFDSDQVTSIVRETFTNLGNRNIQLGGAEKDSDVLGYHIKILGNESNVDSEQNTYNLRNYVERKVCTVNASATIAYIYYAGFTNANEGDQYDRTSIFVNWSGHETNGAGSVFGKILHMTKQGSTWTQGQAHVGSVQGNLPDFTITHDSANTRFIVSIGTSTNGWGTADITIQVGRFAKQIEWVV